MEILCTVSLGPFCLYWVNNQYKVLGDGRSPQKFSHIKLKELITVILIMCLLHICSP